MLRTGRMNGGGRKKEKAKKYERITVRYFKFIASRDSSVGIATGYWLNNQGT
jgi:hypothetical protein